MEAGRIFTWFEPAPLNSKDIWGAEDSIGWRGDGANRRRWIFSRMAISQTANFGGVMAYVRILKKTCRTSYILNAYETNNPFNSHCLLGDICCYFSIPMETSRVFKYEAYPGLRFMEPNQKLLTAPIWRSPGCETVVWFAENGRPTTRTRLLLSANRFCTPPCEKVFPVKSLPYHRMRPLRAFHRVLSEESLLWRRVQRRTTLICKFTRKKQALLR